MPSPTAMMVARFTRRAQPCERSGLIRLLIVNLMALRCSFAEQFGRFETGLLYQDDGAGSRWERKGDRALNASCSTCYFQNLTIRVLIELPDAGAAP